MADKDTSALSDASSNEVKVYKVTGKIIKTKLKTEFRKEIRAVRSEDAVEMIYKEIGSRHRAKRFQIKIIKVEETPPEEIESDFIKKLTLDKEDDR